LVAALQSGATRAEVLRRLVDNEQFMQQQFNPAFVTMEYFGCLRRDPDPDGFTYWLAELVGAAGDYLRVEMVKGFISSIEYRKRFEQW